MNILNALAGYFSMLFEQHGVVTAVCAVAAIPLSIHRIAVEVGGYVRKRRHERSVDCVQEPAPFEVTPTEASQNLSAHPVGHLQEMRSPVQIQSLDVVSDNKVPEAYTTVNYVITKHTEKPSATRWSLPVVGTVFFDNLVSGLRRAVEALAIYVLLRVAPTNESRAVLGIAHALDRLSRSLPGSKEKTSQSLEEISFGKIYELMVSRRQGAEWEHSAHASRHSVSDTDIAR